ncbi:MAG: hypothetical protein ACK5AO_08625 [bacterium]
MNLDRLKNEIVSEIKSGRSLEMLYRKNKSLFHKAFNAVYTDIKETAAAQFWDERLNYAGENFSITQRSDIILVVICSLIAGVIANIPNFFGIIPDYFFQKNISFVVFPALMIYFSIKQGLKLNRWITPFLIVVFSVLYINFFPGTQENDTFILACIHLPIFLWLVLGYVFIGGVLRGGEKKIDFLRWNGNMLVMAAILVLSGGLFTGITVGLFQLIGFDIIEFYMEHIAIWGLAAIPVVATYLVRSNPQLVNNISPTIAKIFTPIVFFTLLIFLGAMIFSKESVYHDRDFLIMFNILLVGVMAIILFSVTEANKSTYQQYSYWFLFGVAVLTIILNSIALSAIIFRLAEYGITPNRIAVLGANMLIFINLLMVAKKLYRVIMTKSDEQQVERVISGFMPFYGIWTAFVVFILPLLFRFQ